MGTKKSPGPLGVALARLRREQGLSQRALGLKSGVHHISIAALENGARQDADWNTVKKLAGGLGVSVAELAEPGDVVPTNPIVDAYLASPFATIDSPSAEEIEWLRGLPTTFWRGVAPSPRAMHHVLEALRTGKPGT